MAVRVTLENVQSFGDFLGNVRVTDANVTTLLEDRTNAVRITTISSTTLLEDRTNPVRVSAASVTSLLEEHSNAVRVSTLTVVALVSIAENPEAESIEMPEPPDLERNPYRPDTPIEFEKVDSVLDDFLREQQSTVRRQHNLIQAGDTTYPWLLLTKINPTQEYTLGSLGRFFHEDFGLIQARYCQFSQMVEDIYINAPVGLFNSAQIVDWIVTNDFNKSDPDLVMGIMTAYQLPPEGYFGWVVVDGANIAPLGIKNYPSFVEKANQHDGYVWVETARLGFLERGRILIRQKTDSEITRFEPGQAYIRLDGFSDTTLRELYAAEIQTLEDHIQSVKGRVDSLEGIAGVQAVMDTLERVETSLTLLTKRIANEERIRAAEDKKLDLRIGTNKVTQTQLDNAINNLKAVLTLVDDGLQLAVNAAQARADAAYDLLNSLDITGINTLLEAFNMTFISLGERIAALEGVPQLIPLVTGDVPPVLVYNEDGSLVLVEYIP